MAEDLARRGGRGRCGPVFVEIDEVGRELGRGVFSRACLGRWYSAGDSIVPGVCEKALKEEDLACRRARDDLFVLGGDGEWKHSGHFEVEIFCRIRAGHWAAAWYSRQYFEHPMRHEARQFAEEDASASAMRNDDLQAMWKARD